MKMFKSDKGIFKYKGIIYNRPCSRGMCIVSEFNGEILYGIEDMIDDGYYKAEIKLKFIGNELDNETKKANKRNSD